MPSQHYTAIRVHKDVKAFIDAAQKARGLSSPNETLRVLFDLPAHPSTKTTALTR